VVDALDAPPHGSAMTAPVLDGDGALAGVLVVEAAPRTAAFTRVDLVALEGIAALLSVALQRLGETGTPGPARGSSSTAATPGACSAG
jgi:hypothetical protein